MTKITKLSWNAEGVTEALVAKANAIGGTVTQEDLARIAAEMSAEFSTDENTKEVSARSIGAKLRKMGDYEVQLASEAPKSNKTAWTEDQEDELKNYLNAHEGEKTYEEVANAVAGGTFTPKQVQGKVLSMQMTDKVKAAERATPVRTFTDEQEDTFISMANSGKFLEEIAEAFGKTVQQVRGKGLSLIREKRLEDMPAQRDLKDSSKKDALEGLDLAEMSLAEIAEAIGSTPRGVKTTLSRRGLVCKDHDGAARRAKLDAAKASA